MVTDDVPTATRTPSIFSPTVGDEPRAVAISKSLKNVARRSRQSRSVWVPSAASSQRRWQDFFAPAIALAFVLVVIVPSLVSAFYVAFLASDQYATEARFAVRSGSSSVLDQFSGLMGMASAQRVQDSLIVADYIRGRGMVQEVDQALNLRRMFSSDDIDFLSRFNPKKSDEELMSYWRRHVEVSIDSMSGIITVIVRAFTPGDSLAIMNKITTLSEGLVNELTDRSRRDALRLAETELARADTNLRKKANTIRDLRNTEGVLDTSQATEAMMKMLGELRFELIRMEQEYSAQRRTISASAPQLRVLEARIESMKDQMDRLNGQMTGSDVDSISKKIGLFDRDKLEKDIAQKQYIAAAAAYERARVELETQNTYLAVFLKPVLAQEALYPKRLWLWSIVFILTLLVWGAGTGAAVLARNNMAS